MKINYSLLLSFFVLLSFGCKKTEKVESGKNNNINKKTGVTDGEELMLPQVNSKANMDLIQAIETNAAARSFEKKEVSMKAISNILYLGYGIILKENNKTIHGYNAVTGATPKNRYAIAHGWGRTYLNVYLVIKQGVYEYLPENHKLKFISKNNDVYNLGSAATNHAGLIIIAVDKSKMPGKFEGMMRDVAFTSAGSLLQNMHIAGAVHNVQFLTEIYIKEDKIKKSLKLNKNIKPLILLSFGHAK
jgi:hypothetical protein